MCAFRTAGNWLFCNRRWLDPLKREERERLESSYDKLCESFPVFARCSKAQFIQCLMDVTIAWSDRINEVPRKSSGASTRKDSTRVPSPGCFDGPPHQDPTSPSMAASAYPMSYDQALLRQRGLVWDGRTGPAAMWAEQCVRLDCGDDSSPCDSGDDSAGCEWELNAGEAVDMKLFQHWASSASGLRVEASELEHFGRSKSF